MEAVVIIGIICLTILGYAVVTKDLNLKKVEALQQLGETVLQNASKFEDNSDVFTLINLIRGTLG